jgi:hypothetical protein
MAIARIREYCYFEVEKKQMPETLLRKAVGIRKAAYELAGEDFKFVSAEIQFGGPMSDLMKTIRRTGSAYISQMGAYEQALHNLDVFLIAKDLRRAPV